MAKAEIKDLNPQISPVEEGKLDRETLDRIDALLVKHEWNGKYRGLYTLKELKVIRQHLMDLADWLEDNKPRFLREADLQFTQHSRFNEKTALCISYIDHIDLDEGETAIEALRDFYNEHLADLYSHLHILPHFPSPIIHDELKGPASRADGGFEAMNYKMDTTYGDPAELSNINADFMFDFVLNHLSAKGDFFQKFIENEEGYETFFVTIPEEKLNEVDLTPVFRPREHHPIFPFTNSKGETKHVWCTFSETQADINIKDPRVFCIVMEALIKDFIGQGASWIRLDALGYLVKMLGIEDKESLTDCFGIEETHNILKVMRCYLSAIAPAVTLVPEINATKSVIETYYGHDNDEGHLVYEFPSAPLSLFTIYAEDATAILKWAQERTQKPDMIGLAFTNSHDGIGVLPMGDVANMPNGTPALDFIIHQIEKRGGGVNYKAKIVDGVSVRVPYEACITWMQAIMIPPERAALVGNRLQDHELDLIVDRFIASQSFIYSAPHCVPADYMGVITCLLNDEDLYEYAGHRRNKNRGLINKHNFKKALENPETNYEHLRNKVFYRKKQMILARQNHPAFSPYAQCDVDIIKIKDGAKDEKPVYSVLRYSPHCQKKVLCLTNTTPHEQIVHIPQERIGSDNLTDILASEKEEGIIYQVRKDGFICVVLDPYQVCWLEMD